MKWWGILMHHSGGTKFYALYISENGTVVKHYGPMSALPNRGQANVTKPAVSALETLRTLRPLLKSKMVEAGGYSGYRLPYRVVTFVEPDPATTRTADVRGTHIATLYNKARCSASDSHVEAGGPTADPVIVYNRLKAAIENTTPDMPPEPAPEPAPAAATAVPRLRGERNYKRPNGETYYPRTISGHVDVAFLHACREASIHVLFEGEAGCGKTALVEAAFPTCHKVLGGPTVDGDKLKGEWLPTGEAGTYRYVDGPVAKAVANGEVLFIDEIARIPADELTVLYDAMDGSGYITIPGRPDELGGPRIDVKKGFIVVGAWNKFVPGATIDRPLWSRFGPKIDYTTDFALAESMGVPKLAVKAARRLNDMVRSDSTELYWAPQMRDLLKFKTNSDLFGEQFAISSLLSDSPYDIRHIILDELKKTFGRADITPLTTTGRA